ncbi:MAG: hypothetical protein IPO92_18170 [Saprospiraceae bacterium]|nr:hypothetical protein [Saprospiraceae bacterium]
MLEATYYESLTYDWTISPSDAATIIKGENGKVSLQLSKVGTHSIILTSCSGVYSKSVTVYALPEPVVIHPTFLCEGQTAKVETNTNYQSYKWKSSIGLNVSVLDKPFLYPDTYTCEVTDVKGCKGVTSFTMSELPKPNISLSTPDNTDVCLTDPSPAYPKLFALDAEDG